MEPSKALFLCPWAGVPGLYPKPRHGPLERVSEAGILLQRAPSVSPQNVWETAVFAPEYEANVDAPGCAPGFRARARGEGDGVCEGKREREKWI